MSPAVRPNFAVVPAQRLDQVLADEIDFRLGLGLRIGDQHDFKGVRARPAPQARNRATPAKGRRRDALEGQVEIGRRPLGW